SGGRCLRCRCLGLEPREQWLGRPEATFPLRRRAPGELLEQRRAAIAVGLVWMRVPELGERARRDRGHEGRHGEGDETNPLDQVAEHAGETRLGLGGHWIT